MSYATKDQQLLLNEYASVGIEFSTPWNPVPPGLQIDCRFREDRAEQFLAWAGLLIKGQVHGRAQRQHITVEKPSLGNFNFKYFHFLKYNRINYSL